MPATRSLGVVLSLVTCLCVGNANAVDFPSAGTERVGVMSQYGVIQNVQNYSSNPFWSVDAPYNQRMPVPVYATGPALTTAECQAAAQTVVSTQCGMRNNCAGVSVDDIKPHAMVQLSQMTGNNYASACGGYIDAAYTEYKSRYAGVAGGVGFPRATNPGGGVQDTPAFTIENPLARKPSQFYGDEWATDAAERRAELTALHAQTGTTPNLAAAQMPKTINDLSFAERVENKRAGYEPFAGTSAYVVPELESDDERRTRELAQAQHEKQLADKAKEIQDLNREIALDAEYYADPIAFCKKYPTNTKYNCVTPAVAQSETIFDDFGGGGGGKNPSIPNGGGGLTPPSNTTNMNQAQATAKINECLPLLQHGHAWYSRTKCDDIIKRIQENCPKETITSPVDYEFIFMYNTKQWDNVLRLLSHNWTCRFVVKVTPNGYQMTVRQ